MSVKVQRTALLMSVAIHAALLAAPLSLFPRAPGDKARLVKIKLLAPVADSRRPPAEVPAPAAGEEVIAAPAPAPAERPADAAGGVKAEAAPEEPLQAASAAQSPPQLAEPADSDTSETAGQSLPAAPVDGGMAADQSAPADPGRAESPSPVSGPERLAAADQTAGEGSALEAVPQAASRPAVNRLVLIRERIMAVRSYPPLARRKGWEGRATVRFRIGADGRPGSLEIVSSSGVGVLDGASLRAVKDGAPYPEVEGWITVPVVFRLEG